ncbi:hypothetical protein [Nocardia transvalensis]|uniref:hypothetical protein n=1 Tax=Nocardia transvalensis TaxID=37333 RepID=UPI001894358D|nr:hypothetical protein [Nocardia transvalensis]MBF6331173.1 hypothetical protein [Nocardia transvalensis]
MGNRDGSAVSGWAAVLAGVAAGPMAGSVLVLLTKPLAGEFGVPSPVMRYVMLAALVVGCVGVAACLRLPRGISRLASGTCVVVAGAGLAIAGAMPDVWSFTSGVLIAGAAAGPLWVAGRALVAVRAGGVGAWYAAVAVGAAGGALAAGAWAQKPRTALIVIACAVLVAGVVSVSAGVRGVHSWTVPRHSRPGPAGLPRPMLLGYVGAGLALGGTVFPALHLLLFRWNVLDDEQWRWLAMAIAPAAVLVLPRRTAEAVAPLAILTAGGALLIATAPGVWTSVIGSAVTLTAATRLLATLDDAALGANPIPNVRISAATALATAIGGLAGLGGAAALGLWFGTGTAVTLLAFPVLACALPVSRAARIGNRRAGSTGTVVAEVAL